MDSNDFVNHKKFIKYVDGVKLVVYETFTYKNKDGETKTVPAQIKVIGLGHERHPTIPFNLFKALIEAYNKDSEIRTFIDHKFKSDEDFQFKEIDGELWIF
jgi:hypothetical protein